jgi:hypothetical protein
MTKKLRNWNVIIVIVATALLASAGGHYLQLGDINTYKTSILLPAELFLAAALLLGYLAHFVILLSLIIKKHWHDLLWAFGAFILSLLIFGGALYIDPASLLYLS